MPIKVPSALPATSILENEHIFTMNEERAATQDIRPLKIAILNLMPTKITTETQLIRLLSNTPLQIELTLLKTETYKSINTAEDHMTAFYKNFSEVKDKKFDGLIITGAPVENLEFCDVHYWKELCHVMDWTKTHVYSTFHICWAAQAGLFYHHSINKYQTEKKVFGIYEHKVLNPRHPLLRGFDEYFLAPHSRHTEIKEAEILNNNNLELLSTSELAGVYIVTDKNWRNFYVTGHSEYDALTLNDEYVRDISKGLDIEVPFNYFPNNDPKEIPKNKWRSHANLLFTNWLNYFVYQRTPYDINEIGVK